MAQRRTWADVRAEMTRMGVDQGAMAEYFGASRTRISTIINGDEFGLPNWEKWMDAINACAKGIPTR